MMYSDNLFIAVVIIFAMPDANFVTHVTAGSPVVLLVLDGFRHDYSAAYTTPNLDRIWKSDGGVLIPQLQPEFPASRLPFLTSLLTGRHTETHQITGEEVYNNILRQRLNPNQTEFWTKAKGLKNIWDLSKSTKICRCWPFADNLANEGQFMDEEVSGSTTTTEAPKSNATQDSIGQAEKLMSQSREEMWNHCINQTLELLMEGGTKFISLYLDEPGITAENFGPDSKELVQAIQDLDTKIGQLLDGLSTYKLEDKVNLIITSTPGFSEVRPEHLIDLPMNTDSKNKNSTYEIFGKSPVLNIQPLPGKDLEVLVMLRKAARLDFEVYITAELPDDFHFRQALDVVQPIILLANQGFAFGYDFAETIKLRNIQSNRTQSLSNVYGLSGYNNSLPIMQTFLMARGPDLVKPMVNKNSQADSQAPKPLETEEPIRVVDLFALLCNLLNIQLPADTDADLKRIAHILKSTVISGTGGSTGGGVTLENVENLLTFLFLPENLPITISVLVGIVLALVGCIVCCVCCIRRRRKVVKASAGYRYSQVKNNRRYTNDGDDATDRVIFSAGDDDDDGDKLQEQSLLAPIPEDA